MAGKYTAAFLSYQHSKLMYCNNADVKRVTTAAQSTLTSNNLEKSRSP